MAAASAACAAVAAHPGPPPDPAMQQQLQQQQQQQLQLQQQQLQQQQQLLQQQLLLLQQLLNGQAQAAAAAQAPAAALALNARLVNLERVGALAFNCTAGDGAQRPYVAVPNANGLTQPANLPPVTSRADLVGLGGADLVRWCQHYGHVLPANTTHEARRRVIARSLGLDLGQNL